MKISANTLDGMIYRTGGGSNFGITKDLSLQHAIN
jgi:hypothetical protein